MFMVNSVAILSLFLVKKITLYFLHFLGDVYFCQRGCGYEFECDFAWLSYRKRNDFFDKFLN